MRHPVAPTTTLCSIALACFVSACCVCAGALDPSLDISQYAHTAWRVREGFGKGDFNSIAQTPDGYLWLGTNFGLLRFDGVRSFEWQAPAGQHLLSNNIYSLLAARDGTLWIGTTKGLASWNGSRLTQYPDLAGQVIYALLEDREGTVWAGGMALPPVQGRLCAIRGSSVHCDGQDGSLGTGVLGLYEDTKGTLWAKASNGLWRRKPGPAQSYPLPGDPGGMGAPIEDGDGHILVPTRGGIEQLLDGKIEAFALPGNIKNLRPQKLLHDHEGGLWIGTLDRGLLHLHNGRVDEYTSSDGLSADFVFDIVEDREGNVWVTTTGGLDRFREYPIVTLTNKQGLSNNSVYTIQADSGGSVWLGTRGGLDRWDKGQVVAHPSRGAGSAPSTGAFLFLDGTGRLWVFAHREAGYMRNEHFIPLNTLPSGSVLSVAEDASGDLWIIRLDAGLAHVRGGRMLEQISWAALGHKDAATIVAADPSHGGLWLGFYNGGVGYFADGAIRKSYTAADGLGEGRVNSLRFGRDAVLWAATEGGLSRMKDGHFATLNSKNGLPCDAVHWAMEDDDHSLWLYMPCGLVRIARTEKDAWTTAADKKQDSTQKIQFTAFDSSDGVRTIPQIGLDAQVAKSPDGKLWFSPWDGVSVIDPHHLPVNKLPPPVHIEQVTADDKKYDPANGLQLLPHVRDLTIDYTALSLVAPEKIHFRYKLEGQDPDWREVVNDRQVQYSNLAPRHYIFRVMASNNSGVWNETGAALEFSVLPALYQTVWFQLLCVAAFIGSVWALYQLRLHQMQRQFALGLEARAGERLRIARELHDTLLQSFQGVAFQLQAARKLILRKADNAEEVLDDAIAATEEAIREGRSAIRDLRPEPAAQRNLSELLDAAGRELATAAELNGQAPIYRVLVEGKQQDLSPMLQDEVYRISREVIRNAFAHAAASHIEVEIRYEQDHLRLRVRDDGKGIDPKTLQAGGQSGHFGIPGMRERAQRIGAHLDFWSEIGAGSEVELTVPASMAYQGPRNGHRFRLFRWAGRDEQRS